jgi:hypothetical protein
VLTFQPSVELEFTRLDLDSLDLFRKLLSVLGRRQRPSQRQCLLAYGGGQEHSPDGQVTNALVDNDQIPSP